MTISSANLGNLQEAAKSTEKHRTRSMPFARAADVLSALDEQKPRQGCSSGSPATSAARTARSSSSALRAGREIVESRLERRLAGAAQCGSRRGQQQIVERRSGPQLPVRRTYANGVVERHGRQTVRRHETRCDWLAFDFCFRHPASIELHDAARRLPATATCPDDLARRCSRRYRRRRCRCRRHRCRPTTDCTEVRLPNA